MGQGAKLALSLSEYLTKVWPDELKSTDHSNLVWFVALEELLIDSPPQIQSD